MEFIENFREIENIIIHQFMLNSISQKKHDSSTVYVAKIHASCKKKKTSPEPSSRSKRPPREGI